MIPESSQSVVKRAKAVYEARYRQDCERMHMNKYLCIEPDSGQSFLGETFDDAVNAAIDAFPDRLTYTLQIGKPAALHLGVLRL